MLIKNIKIWVTKDTQKHDFLKKRMSPDLLLAIPHLKAEIESFKMVCNMPMGLFFDRNEGITYMWGNRSQTLNVFFLAQSWKVIAKNSSCLIALFSFFSSC